MNYKLMLVNVKAGNLGKRIYILFFPFVFISEQCTFVEIWYMYFVVDYICMLTTGMLPVGLFL